MGNSQSDLSRLFNQEFLKDELLKNLSLRHENRSLA